MAAGPHQQVPPLEVRQGVAGIGLRRRPVALHRLVLPAEPGERVPPAGARPRLPRLGEAEAVAHVQDPLVGAARLRVPAGGQHDLAFYQQARDHEARARCRGGVHGILEGGVHFTHVKAYIVRSVHKVVPSTEHLLKALPVVLDEPGQDRHVALLGQPLDRRHALKGIAGRLDPRRAQGHRPVDALDRLDDDPAPRAALFV